MPASAVNRTVGGETPGSDGGTEAGRTSLDPVVDPAVDSVVDPVVDSVVVGLGVRPGGAVTVRWAIVADGAVAPCSVHDDAPTRSSTRSFSTVRFT